MLRTIISVCTSFLLVAPAAAEDVSFLLCEYESRDAEMHRKIQSIPVFYKHGELVAIGKLNHCLTEPEFFINETYATWRCVTAQNSDQSAAKSVYVEVNRFTGRFHRNVFAGHYDDRVIDEIWHGVCTIHHEAQF